MSPIPNDCFFHRFLQTTPSQILSDASHLARSEPYWNQFIHFFTDYRAARDHFGAHRIHPLRAQDIKVDRFVLWKRQQDSQPQFVGFGRAASIVWDGTVESLPQGWTGTVQTAFDDAVAGRQPNTYVPITILVDPAFRRRGWSPVFIDEFKRCAIERRLSNLIIPLQETARGETPERAAMSMAEYVELKRPDGTMVDHWFRMHVRLGAEPLAVCQKSHGYAMSIEDLAAHWEVPEESGTHILRRTGEDPRWFGWQPYRKWFVDRGQGVATSWTGCLWVSHMSGDRGCHGDAITERRRGSSSSP